MQGQVYIGDQLLVLVVILDNFLRIEKYFVNLMYFFKYFKKYNLYWILKTYIFNFT